MADVLTRVGVRSVVCGVRRKSTIIAVVGDNGHADGSGDQAKEEKGDNLYQV